MTLFQPLSAGAIRRMVCHQPGHLDFGPAISQHLRNRAKGDQRPAELLPLPGVSYRFFECGLREAHSRTGDGDPENTQRSQYEIQAVSSFAKTSIGRDLDPVEDDLTHYVRRNDVRSRAYADPVRISGDEHQRITAAVSSEYNVVRRHTGIGYKRLVASQLQVFSIPDYFSHYGLQV